MTGPGLATATSRVGELPPAIADFFEHWLSLSEDGRIPTLEAFLSRPDPRFQPMVSIIDLTGLQSMTIRLFGTGLVDVLGKDLTGTDAVRWYNDKARDVMIEFTTRMLEARCGLCCLRSYATSMGRHIRGASLTLPLRRAGGQISSIVVYFVIMNPLDRNELAIDLSVISDPRWIDVGFGVPMAPAEALLKKRWQVESSLGRRAFRAWNWLSSLVRRFTTRAADGGLFRGTGDAELNAFFEHWLSLRDGRLVPTLAAYLDRPHPRFQPYVTLIDVEESGRTSVRLLGSERHDLAARPEAKSDSMRVIYSPRLYPILKPITIACVTRPCGFRALRTFESSDGQLHRGAVITLPLATGDPKVRCLAHFQHLLGSKTYRDAAQLVTAIHNPTWIDLGAGVPPPVNPTPI